MFWVGRLYTIVYNCIQLYSTCYCGLRLTLCYLWFFAFLVVWSFSLIFLVLWFFIYPVLWIWSTSSLLFGLNLYFWIWRSNIALNQFQELTFFFLFLFGWEMGSVGLAELPWVICRFWVLDSREWNWGFAAWAAFARLFMRLDFGRGSIRLTELPWVNWRFWVFDAKELLCERIWEFAIWRNFFRLFLRDDFERGTYFQKRFLIYRRDLNNRPLDPAMVAWR